MDQNPHVVVLPSPGMGHLIPLLAFAKQLVRRHHHLNVTVVMPTSGRPPQAQKSLLQTLPKTIKHIFLPPVDLPKELDNTEAQIFLTMSGSLPSLRNTLTSLTTAGRLVALVADPFGMEALDIAKEFGASQYLFFTATAMALSVCFHLPTLDQMVTGEYRDLPEPIKLPGCVPVHGRDLMEPVQDRSHQAYKQLLATLKRMASVDAIILNSFVELEEGAIKALLAKEPGRPPVYPVGPLIQNGSTEGERSECLQWLDGQPGGSVLFVSFGSGGTPSHEQLNELAMGLEISGQRFLWVVRSPNNKSADAAFFNSHAQDDPLSFLPEGFLERTKKQGLVVPFWAPQMEVLSHGSTGGFLTHCGWNSTLESVVQGVPLIAWPLYAEQKMNAVMLAHEDGLNVALRPKSNENGLVGREEVARVVRTLMEGEEGRKVREKMKGLKVAAAKVLSEDGSSTKSLSELAFKWKN